MESNKTEKSFSDKIKEDLMLSLLEDFLPKIKPILKPAIEKALDFFGNDSKLIVLKKIGDSLKVIILDNEKGSYNISSGETKEFTSDKESIIKIIDIHEFVENLLKGELFNKID